MQGLLELLGIPYTGSGVLASAIGMDKYVCRRILEISGIDVPRTIPIPRRLWEAEKPAVIGEIVREIGFPCVVKPCREGCSTAVKKVVAAEGIPEAVDKRLFVGQRGSRRGVPGRNGGDLRRPRRRYAGSPDPFGDDPHGRRPLPGGQVPLRPGGEQDPGPAARGTDRKDPGNGRCGLPGPESERIYPDRHVCPGRRTGGGPGAEHASPA